MAQGEGVWLHANGGQWPKEILSKIELVNGEMALMNDGFAYNFHNGKSRHHHHDAEEGHEEEEFKGHFILQKFKSTWAGKPVQKDTSEFYQNYFLSKDTSRWASKVYSFKTSQLPSFLPNIDMQLQGGEQTLEYSFVLRPGAKVSDLTSEIQGANRLEVDEEGNLQIHHNFGTIQQSAPIAWQVIEGKRIEVNCTFFLRGNLLEFRLDSYDETQELFIDPSLTFSSFSGAISDNWGSTATPASDESVFGAGIVFGSDFPTTVGAYDESFNEVTLPGFDVAIMKFTSDGSTLIYSTFLGGNDNEFPSSMVANSMAQTYLCRN
mgnify:CR=1 FL=1